MIELFKGKKGNIIDFFYIIPILFIASITIFVSALIISKVNVTGVFSTDAEAQKGIDKAYATILSFDNMMLFILLGMSLFVIISSALVDNHPAFFIISIFMLVVAIIVASQMSNTFWIFSNTDSIIDTATAFPKISFLMERLPYYILMMGAITLSTMFISFKKRDII